MNPTATDTTTGGASDMMATKLSGIKYLNRFKNRTVNWCSCDRSHLHDLSEPTMMKKGNENMILQTKMR